MGFPEKKYGTDCEKTEGGRGPHCQTWDRKTEGAQKGPGERQVGVKTKLCQGSGSSVKKLGGGREGDKTLVNDG